MVEVAAAKQVSLDTQQQEQPTQQETEIERARRPSMLQGLLGSDQLDDEPTSYASSLLALADDEDDDDEEQERDAISVVFVEEGPLGLNLTPCSIGNGVMILAIQQILSALFLPAAMRLTRLPRRPTPPHGFQNQPLLLDRQQPPQQNRPDLKTSSSAVAAAQAWLNQSGKP